MMMRIPDHKIGEKVICPVCKKQYIFSEENCYIICGDYACEWKCFIGHVKKIEKEKEENNKKQK